MTLRAETISIGYGRTSIAAGISLTAEPGRVLAILGPNGGGKTTLLKTLLGLQPLLSGSVDLDGRPLGELGVRERAGVMAYVPQVHAGTFGFSVREVVLMGRSARAGMLGRPSSADRAAADAALARLGISALAERVYTEISGGERQLALIARALAQEPEIVMFDEPTASLDLGNQTGVLNVIRSLAEEGRAVVFTTHDPNHADRCADAALLLAGGVQAYGHVSDVINPHTLAQLYGAPVECVTDQTGRRLFSAKLTR
jgi:iron complex transport system ATP-binding protein